MSRWIKFHVRLGSTCSNFTQSKSRFSFIFFFHLNLSSNWIFVPQGGLQVSGNPLECDCEIAWLSMWLRRWLRESRQIHTASQSDARQLRTLAGRAVCTETTPSYSSDKVLLTLGTPHTACQASALSSGNYERLPKVWLSFIVLFILTIECASDWLEFTHRWYFLQPADLSIKIKIKKPKKKQ